MHTHHRNLLYLIITLLVASNLYQRKQYNLTEKVAMQLLDSLNAEQDKNLELWKQNTVLKLEIEKF